MAIKRVLQILQDTDATDQHLAALELHHGLTRAGCEVRTLALGPGKIGQLAQSVPVISPSHHSVAAYTQLRVEQRWADAFILQGARVAEVAALLPSTVPTAVSLWLEPSRWQAGKRPSRRLHRSIRRGSQLVVNNSAAQTAVDQVFNVHPDSSGTAERDTSSRRSEFGRPFWVHLIHTGVNTADLTSSAALTDAQVAARRVAAKQALGLDPSTLAIREIAPLAVPKKSAPRPKLVDLQQAAVSVGMSFIDSSPTADVTEEVLLAASDIVVSESCENGPSVELLRSMQAGAIAVTASSSAMTELIEDHVTGLSFLADTSAGLSVIAALSEISGDPSLRSELARAGGKRVQAEYQLGVLQSCWLKTLNLALA